MPASSLLEIYNVNEAADRALYAALQSVGIGASIPRDTEDLDDVIVIPNLQLGPARPRSFKRPDGNWDHDFYSGCVVEISLLTPRLQSDNFAAETATLASLYTLFAQQMALIRLALSFPRLGYLNAQLPYHAFSALMPLGTTQGLNGDTGHDTATIRYGCNFGVRSDAWPVAGSAAYTEIVPST